MNHKNEVIKAHSTFLAVFLLLFIQISHTLNLFIIWLPSSVLWHFVRSMFCIKYIYLLIRVEMFVNRQVCIIFNDSNQLFTISLSRVPLCIDFSFWEMFRSYILKGARKILQRIRNLEKNGTPNRTMQNIRIILDLWEEMNNNNSM